MFDLLTITLTLPIYVSDAIFSGIYVAAFLKPKHSIKLIHILWTTIYLSVEDHNLSKDAGNEEEWHFF